MTQKHSFVASSSIGSIGESLFFSLASISLPGIEIINVTKDKLWQKQGVDFIIDDVFYDVKFDTKANSTGNLAFETVSKSKDGVVIKEGWAYSTKANCISYIVLNELRWSFYFFTPNEVLKLVKTNEDNKKSVYNYGYESEVVLIPVSTLSHKKIINIPVIGNFKLSTREDFSFIHEFLKGDN